MTEDRSAPAGDALARVEAAVRDSGLDPRGAFHPRPQDAVPPLADGRPTLTLVLLGNAGPRMWDAFAPTRTFGPHPLDHWTREVVTALAQRLGATPLFPFDGPPHHPFQRWAMRAGPVHPSPLGILVHPELGLWHAYRAALALGEHLPLPPRASTASPCDACADRPCLSACPVGAFAPEGFDPAACGDWLARPRGERCMHDGCAARLACPVGRDRRYAPAQMRFHMAAFARAVDRS